MEWWPHFGSAWICPRQTFWCTRIRISWCTKKARDVLLKGYFTTDPKLGMVVSMGCEQADANGGRSRCYCSFRQDGIRHGRRPSKEGNFVAMADGCFLAMRRSIMDACGIPDLRLPVHHFYERDWILEMVTRGYRAKVIPLDADHLSGKTACQPECQEWFNQRGGEQAIYDEARSACTWRSGGIFCPCSAMPQGTTTHGLVASLTPRTHELRPHPSPKRVSRPREVLPVARSDDAGRSDLRTWSRSRVVIFTSEWCFLPAVSSLELTIIQILSTGKRDRKRVESLRTFCPEWCS